MFKNTIRFTLPSTRSHGLPDRHTNLFNVLRGIVITIMHHAAISANPGSNAQRHFFSNHTAGTTAFTRGIPTVNLSKILAVPLAFVLQIQTKRTKTSIRNAFGKAVVLTMPRTFKSSIQITSKRRTRSVVTLFRWSARESAMCA